LATSRTIVFRFFAPCGRPFGFPDEVRHLRRDSLALKEVVAELTLENRLLKKSMIGDGGEAA
jgi:hypothetical protein